METGEKWPPVRRRPVRLGVIGAGMVARVGHGPGARADGRAVVAACADPDAANRARFVKTGRGMAGYAEAREMLERADLDAVVIASPPWLHAEHVEAAVDARVAVLCEKPLAGTIEDCDLIVAAAGRPGARLIVGHSKRFELGFQRIKEWLVAGRLGRVHQLSVVWHYYIPDFSSGLAKRGLDFMRDRLGRDLLKEWGAWRMLDPRSGGGDFFDHGPHYLDLARWFFGEIDSISAETNRLVPARLFEDQAVATLKMKSGTIVVIEKSNQVVGRPTGTEIGHLYSDRMKVRFECEQEYQLKPMRSWRYGLQNIPLDLWTPWVSPWGKRQSLYFRQMRHFLDLVTGETSLTPAFPGPWAADARAARAAVAWTRAAYRSAEEGVKIKAEEIEVGRCKAQGVKTSVK